MWSMLQPLVLKVQLHYIRVSQNQLLSLKWRLCASCKSDINCRTSTLVGIEHLVGSINLCHRTSFVRTYRCLSKPRCNRKTFVGTANVRFEHDDTISGSEENLPTVEVETDKGVELERNRNSMIHVKRKNVHTDLGLPEATETLEENLEHDQRDEGVEPKFNLVIRRKGEIDLVTTGTVESEESNTSENRGIDTVSKTFKDIDKVDKHADSDGDSSSGYPTNGRFVETSIEKFLEEMDMVYLSGYTGYSTVCPKLGKPAMKKRKEENKLYIDSTSGYFHCRYCGLSGSWLQLKDNVRFLKSLKRSTNRNIQCFKNVVDVVGDKLEVHPEVKKQLDGALDFSKMSDEMFDTVLSIFDWNGIQRKTFIDYGVTYKLKDDKYWVIFPTYSVTGGSVTSVNIYRGGITEDGDIKTTPVATYPRVKEVAHLFGWQNHRHVKRATIDTLIITSTEANAMTVSQTTGILALSLKNMSQLPQEVLPHLENYSKIILWLGTDMKAWENTKIFAKKLNDKRCHVFRPTVLQYMPLEVLQRGEDVTKVLVLARLISHKAIVTFSNVRQEVYSEFAHYKQVAGVQWKRYTKLNTLLKGHRRGELTILTGPTGSGKTTFLSEYSLDLCMQGVNTLWGSFEISNVRLIKLMMQQYSGKNIAKHLDAFDEIADEFSCLPMYFMMYFGQEEINKVLEAMSHAVYIHDISHVIVDNLQFMMGMDYTEKNRFFKQDRIVSEFRRFATEKNCHVTLIIHPRKVNEGDELSTASVFGSAKVTQEADNILLIQDQRLTRSSGRKYIQVAKNRFDGDLGVMTLTFNKETLSFNTVEKKKQPKIVDDVELEDIEADIQA